jgi:hypothetical protein
MCFSHSMGKSEKPDLSWIRKVEAKNQKPQGCWEVGNQRSLQPMEQPRKLSKSEEVAYNVIIIN